MSAVSAPLSFPMDNNYRNTKLADRILQQQEHCGKITFWKIPDDCRRNAEQTQYDTIQDAILTSARKRTSGSGISWTICKQPAPRSRQITTPTPHHSIFTGRMLFLTPNQQCQTTDGHQSNLIFILRNTHTRLMALFPGLTG